MKAKPRKLKPSKYPLIAFLYEGETEEIFYRALLKELREKFPVKTGILHKPLDGKVYFPTVAREILKILNKHTSFSNIHVVVAIDREGPPDTLPPTNFDELRKRFADERRIKSITEIIATQHLESWFFLDMEGIYSHLRTQKSKQRPDSYKAYQSFTHKDLSHLFRQHEKEYEKGSDCKAFIDKLDLVKIYNNCPELKEGIDLIIAKCI